MPHCLELASLGREDPLQRVLYLQLLIGVPVLLEAATLLVAEWYPARQASSAAVASANVEAGEIMVEQDDTSLALGNLTLADGVHKLTVGFSG